MSAIELISCHLRACGPVSFNSICCYLEEQMQDCNVENAALIATVALHEMKRLGLADTNWLENEFDYNYR